MSIKLPPAWLDQPAAELAISVGEASGDWIAALAVSELLKRNPELRVQGIAGPHLRKSGVQALYHSEMLSVRGYVEVLRHLPRLLKMRANLMEHWANARPPRVFLGVDAPDFNLKLALKLRQNGVKTVQLVCPSIWAWRWERIHLIRQACDHVLCIFPFEPQMLEKEGISASYIGHPMANLVPDTLNPAQARAALGLPAQGQLLAMMPGSRQAEVKYIGPAFVEAGRILLEEMPGLQLVTPLPNEALMATFKAMLPENLLARWKLVLGQSHDCLHAADAVMLASGTATLEAMMFRKPMVIAYKMPWLSHWFMKQKERRLPYIGLPNILLNEFAVPELIQDEATGKALAEKARFQLEDQTNRMRLESKFTAQLHALRRPSGALVGDFLEGLLAGPGSV